MRLASVSVPHVTNTTRFFPPATITSLLRHFEPGKGLAAMESKLRTLLLSFAAPG
jgi:hypothetical protein